MEYAEKVETSPLPTGRGKKMTIKQTIEIKIPTFDGGPAPATIISQSTGRRGATKCYASVAAAKADLDAQLAARGVVVTWLVPAGFLADTIALIGEYEVRS
jgi:hypothetical protein